LTRTREALVEAFASFPSRLAAAARIAAPPPPAEWSVAEITRHLIAVEVEVWSARFAQVASEDEPRWAWTEPGLALGFDGETLDSILAAFAAARATTVAVVHTLDVVGWSRAGIHATYGRLDMAGLLRLATDHDAEHLEAIGLAW
jgi:hypothetical protein